MEKKNDPYRHFGIFIVIGIMIGMVINAGFKKHESNKNSVISISERILNNNGVTQFSINDVNLPINYTILNQQVESTIFISKNSKIRIIEVDVIPRGGYPFLLAESQMYVKIDPLAMLGLIDLEN